MTTIFDSITIDEARLLLASHLPVGRLWEKAFDPNANIGRLIAGLSMEFYRLSVLTETIYGEFDIRQANELISEWEKSVSIPNEFFPGTYSLEDKRKNIEMLFTNFGGVQTKEDLIRIAEFYGYTVKINNGTTLGGFPLLFPITNFSTKKSARFTIIVNASLTSVDVGFPLPFPLPFSAGGLSFLQRIFELLVQSNVQVIFSNKF